MACGVLRVPIEHARGEVDALVGGLRGQDDGDQQLERRAVFELGRRMRICSLQALEDFGDLVADSCRCVDRAIQLRGGEQQAEGDECAGRQHGEQEAHVGAEQLQARARRPIRRAASPASCSSEPRPTSSRAIPSRSSTERSRAPVRRPVEDMRQRDASQSVRLAHCDGKVRDQQRQEQSSEPCRSCSHASMNNAMTADTRPRGRACTAASASRLAMLSSTAAMRWPTLTRDNARRPEAECVADRIADGDGRAERNTISQRRGTVARECGRHAALTADSFIMALAAAAKIRSRCAP